MKIALAHDYLIQWGGAENVLLALSEIFPQAPIYTLLYDKKKTYGKFEGRIAKTSFLDYPIIRNNHRAFIPLLPLAANTLSIPDEYDTVLTSSASFAKGIKVGEDAKHIVYCHTPLRYAWEPEYLNGKWKMENGKWLMKPVLRYLRNWDYEAAQKSDALLTNSNFIAQKIKKYYNRESQVIYPPVDLSVFYKEKTNNPQPATNDYFLAVGRFLHYKRFDLVIETFNKLDWPLKIVGSGPEEKRLKKMAKNSKIKFLPFENNTDKLRELYAGARALIFPQVEDFGLVAAEAIACGTPVIAYKAGGAQEIVTDKCGTLFGEQTSEGLEEAMAQFIKSEKKWRPPAVAKEAERFSKEKFRNEIIKAVKLVSS